MMPDLAEQLQALHTATLKEEKPGLSFRIEVISHGIAITAHVERGGRHVLIERKLASWGDIESTSGRALDWQFSRLMLWVGQHVR